MELEFTGEVWHWKGPAPHHFVTVPEDEAASLGEIARAVTYGWGMIPARVSVGATSVTTSLYPKDGGYVVPLKVALRRPEKIEVGDVVTLLVEVDV